MPDVSDSGGTQRHPQVFVVDSQAFPHPAPGRPEAPRVPLLYTLLLAAALLGVVIEAGFICHLYSSRPAHTTQMTPDVQKTESMKGDRDSFQSSAHESNEISPGKTPQPKPAAFLQSVWPASGGDGVLLWSMKSFPGFLRGVDIKNNDSLFFQQEGYYFIFSKISHLQSCRFFLHAIMRRTDSYANKPIPLMQSSRSPCGSTRAPASSERSSSYLGGVFHLQAGDRVFVKVENSSEVLYETHENFFGAFMI